METETKARKHRGTHQIITMLLVFVMGIILGWVLKSGQTTTEHVPPSVSTVVPDEPRETESPPDTPEVEAPDRFEVSEVPRVPAETDAPEPEPVDTIEDVWPARHLFVAVNGATLDDETRALLAQLKPGGIVLLDDNIENRNQTIQLVTSIKEAVGLGTELHDLPLIAVAQEGGVLNRLNLEFAPGAPELAAQGDLGAAGETGRQFALSCRDRGIGILLAPVLDVVLPGAPEIIAARSFGENREVVEAMGLAFADGAMQAGVAPIVKHYPGHGATATQTPSGLAVIELEQSEELARILFPFAQAVLAGVPGMMVGHIAVPWLDEDHPERPASLSPLLVREYLRNRWNFNGVVLSDDIAVAAAATEEDIERTAVLALAAGSDALIVGDPSPEAIRGICAAIDAAVADGELSSDQLNASKRRLDALQAWLQAPTGLPGPVPRLAQSVDAPEETAASESPAEDTKQDRAEAPAEEAAAETEAAPAAQQPVFHTVDSGDTLTRLSARYGVSIDEIRRWNGLADDNIRIGQRLQVSPPAE